jgi:hypothetical protein
MRKKLRLIYLWSIAFVLVMTAASLIHAGTHISNIVLSGIALASIVTSLVPFFISMYLFKKFETEKPPNQKYKVFGIIVYVFCFPIKVWVIIATIYETLFGNNHWAFG